MTYRTIDYKNGLITIFNSNIDIKTIYDLMDKYIDLEMDFHILDFNFCYLDLDYKDLTLLACRASNVYNYNKIEKQIAFISKTEETIIRLEFYISCVDTKYVRNRLFYELELAKQWVLN